MLKSKIKQMFNDAIQPKQLCRVYMRYDPNYYYYYPLKASDKLFLGIEEDDFMLDGYQIRRFCDVVKLEYKNDMCCQINVNEGLVDSIAVPDVDVTDWKSVFLSLQKIGKNIIIEHEEPDVDENLFAIGRIDKVLNNKLYFTDFDADGVWDEDGLVIPYSSITSVTFNSRYVNVFSKYVNK